MTDSATMPAERQDNNLDSPPVENKYLYYWCAAFDEFGIAAMPLPTSTVSGAPEAKAFDRPNRLPSDMEIGKRLSRAKDAHWLLLLRAGIC